MISINTLEGRIKLFFEKKGMEKYFNSKIYRFGTAHLMKKGIDIMFIYQ